MSLGSDQSPAAPPAKWNRMKWALVASLAVNLLILGAVFGHRHHQGGWRGHRGGGESFGLMGYARTLDKDRRAVIRKSVQAERPNLKVLREEVLKARLAAGEALIAEPFDKDKVRAALERIGEAEARQKNAGVAAFLAAAEQLTPGERRGLFEWWKRRRPSHFPRGGGDVEKRE